MKGDLLWRWSAAVNGALPTAREAGARIQFASVQCKVKGSGQECPLHTRPCRFTTFLGSLPGWCDRRLEPFRFGKFLWFLAEFVCIWVCGRGRIESWAASAIGLPPIFILWPAFCGWRRERIGIGARWKSGERRLSKTTSGGGSGRSRFLWRGPRERAACEQTDWRLEQL